MDHSSHGSAHAWDRDDRVAPTEAMPSWRIHRRRALRSSVTARSTRPEGDHLVRTLMLDMGGVVIPTLFETVALPGFPAGPLRHDPDYRGVERGRVPEREYWRQLAERHGDLDLGELWRSCSRVRREWLPQLGRLISRVRIVVFTNDMERWFGPEWPQRFPELDLFDVILEAGKLGKLKPDPEAFRRALDALDERPRRCLFVDDLETNVDVASAVGMNAELFNVRDPHGSVARILQRLGLHDDMASGRRAFSAPRPRQGSGCG